MKIDQKMKTMIVCQKCNNNNNNSSNNNMKICSRKM